MRFVWKEGGGWPLPPEDPATLAVIMVAAKVLDKYYLSSGYE